MSPLAPSPETVARFRRDLATLGPVPERLGLAVSGGPDSLALLLLAAAALPGRVEAATVDHGLRRESALEALHVEDICGRLGCLHAILEVQVPDGPGGVQAEARAARYEALGSWARRRRIGHIATAHHADDQAETVLMRLQRGSGIAGLAGIRPVRRDGELFVLRPLLPWTKAELVHLVAASGVEALEDVSNTDARFDRTAARRFLADNPTFEPQRLARTAASALEAHEALAWSAEQLIASRWAEDEDGVQIDAADLPREYRRRLLARAIAALRRRHELKPDWTGGEDVEGLLQMLEAGGTGTLAGIMARGGSTWRLALAPLRRTTGTG